MGTYTANKNLYMPTVGEQGWGTLMNGNLETIDNFLKPITESDGTYTFTGNQTGGSISATSITNSGTLTSTGKITANGGIGTTSLTTSGTITSTGKITSSNVIQCQKVYVDGKIVTTQMSNYNPIYAETAVQSTTQNFPNSGTTVATSTLTVSGYETVSITYPVRVGCGVYVPAASNVISGSLPSSVSRTATLNLLNSEGWTAENPIPGSVTGYLYVNNVQVATITQEGYGSKTTTYTVKNGDTVYARGYGNKRGSVTVTIAAVTPFYLDGI